MQTATMANRWLKWTIVHRSTLKKVVIATALAVLAIQWGQLAASQRGDFHLHWELGHRLATGTFIYESGQTSDSLGHDHPYPPFWALVHAPLTVFPLRVAQLLMFPLFVVALLGLCRTLSRWTERALPLCRDARFWATVVAVVLASRFLVRDMLEGGVNLAVVALAWFGVFLWTRHREWVGGIALGLAIALKCTPALFLPYFVLKRQWKMVATTLVATVAFTISPMIVMGPSEYARTFSFWFHHALAGVSEVDPSVGVLGDEPFQNISLRPSLARFLMYLPSGHASRLNHALYFEFLNLSPITAGFVIKGILLLLLAAVAWTFRAPIRCRDDLSVMWECAAVSILMLLYSPITWGQHCVAVFPALYLISRTWYARGALPNWMNRALMAYVLFILVMNRAIVGKNFCWLLDSYHISTWCLLALLAVTIGCRARCLRDESGAAAPLNDIGTGKLLPST